MIVALVNLPLWPANGEALARGDLAWVRTVTRRMTVISVLTIVLPAIPLTLAGGPLLTAWLGMPLDVTGGLLFALAAWWILQSAVSPRFMVQNSVGVIRPQLLGWTLYLVISLPLKWFAADTLGLAAVPAVGAAVYAVTVLPSAIWGYRRALALSTPGAGIPPGRSRSTDAPARECANCRRCPQDGDGRCLGIPARTRRRRRAVPALHQQRHHVVEPVRRLAEGPDRPGLPAG